MKAILHADKQWGIGKNNDLMFSIPLDMKFFRETTLNKIVVMGNNTLKSFPNGKPLKNRINILIIVFSDRYGLQCAHIRIHVSKIKINKRMNNTVDSFLRILFIRHII